MKSSAVVAAGAALCAVFTMSEGHSAAGAWKPDRPVELIVNTAPGASPDRNARLMQKIFQERKLIEAPVTVSNRVGGGGAVAYAYLNSRPGDAHMVAIASKLILASHIMGRGPHHGDFTPLAHLFGEYSVIGVKADSPVKSGREIVERLKKDPTALTIGIATSLGNVSHQAIADPLKEAGIDLKKTKVVVFQASTLAITAMLGGHVDLVPMVPGTAHPLVQEGRIRLLAITAPKRASGLFANVPTWRELGYDTVVSNWRSVIGPKGLGPAQIAYWERTLRELVQTEEWKQNLERSHAENEFLPAAETRKLMDADYAKLKDFLTELELVK